MYKCTLNSKKMTEILVQFYNQLIKKEYYPKRWLKVLDIMLEKGKGPVLGKLRTIQLMEADMQLLMRIFLGTRVNKDIKKDTRISKFNFGSRKQFSINKASLEKRLLYDSRI